MSFLVLTESHCKPNASRLRKLEILSPLKLIHVRVNIQSAGFAPLVNNGPLRNERLYQGSKRYFSRQEAFFNGAWGTEQQYKVMKVFLLHGMSLARNARNCLLVICPEANDHAFRSWLPTLPDQACRSSIFSNMHRRSINTKISQIIMTFLESWKPAFYCIGVSSW